MLRRGGPAHRGQLVTRRVGLLRHFAHTVDPSWPPIDYAAATPEGHTGDVATAHPYLAAPHPRAFAHRGWHLDDLDGMENSLSAFRRAVAEGYRYLETDVHATSDGVVVVHHDHRLDRTTDGSGVIAHQTWAEVHTAKVCGREPISRLEDVLEELPEAHFNIDVKAASAVVPFLRTIDRAGAYDRVAAASFSDARLAKMRRLAGPKLVTSMGPRSVAAILACGRLPLLRLGFLARGAMAQVPVRQGKLTIVDKAFLQAAERTGIEVHTWTIDDAAQMRELLDLGVHGIVTDRPDILREVLIEREAWPPAA
jgi:glycerophosphoryl diester phosphodiesterase